MNPVDDARQGGAGSMQQASMSPDAVIGRDLVQILEQQDTNLAAEPLCGLPGQLRRTVRRDQIEAAPQHLRAVLTAAATQFENPRAGRKLRCEDVDAVVLCRPVTPRIGAGFLGIEAEGLVVLARHGRCQLLPERIATVATPAPISSVPPALLNSPIARGLLTTARAREAISA